MENVILQTRGLTKRYGSFAALDSLDLTVQKGEVLGYLGPNGAGKTTTIRLLLGLIKPTSGGAEIFGLDAQKQKIAVHKRLAYVPGEATLWPHKARGDGRSDAVEAKAAAFNEFMGRLTQSIATN